MTSAFVAFTYGQFLVDEPLSELFHAFRGVEFAVRDRARFLSRLKHECRDVETRGRSRTFSLAVFAAAPASEHANAEELARLSERVRRSVRTRDVVGEFPTGEVWVLALGADANAAAAMCSRLEKALAAKSRKSTHAAIQIGWSTFETDATDPARLIRVARDRAHLPDVDLEEAA